MTYEEMTAALKYQRIHGVDLSEYANTDGYVDALVCDCGLYRRDQPPGTYVCGCGLELYKSQTKTVCQACSAQIFKGRSSYASYRICDQCRNAN